MSSEFAKRVRRYASPPMPDPCVMPDAGKTRDLDIETLVRHLDRGQRLSGTGSWEWRAETDELFWSEQVYRVCGVERGDFRPTFQAFLSLVHPDDRGKLEGAVERAVLAHEPYCIDYRIILPSGQVRTVRAEAEVDMDPGCGLLGLFGTICDVTQLRAMEVDSRAMTGMLSSMLRISPEAIIITDAAGRILQFSAGAEAVFGYRARDAIGRGIEILMAERVRAGHAAHVERFAKGRRPSLRMGERSSVQALRRNGEEFPAEVSLAKLEAEDGLTFVTVVRDLSEVRAAEARLTEAREQAERASVAKSSFLANMSHEIRTPLNGVLGVASALARTAMSPKQREMVHLIETSGRALEGLLSDILDLAKIDAGRMALRLEPFNLEELVSDTIALFRASASQKGVDLRLNMSCRSGSNFVGDELKIRQILSNFLSNAVKFTDAGEIVLSLVDSEDDRGCCRISFSVRDTGIGFPPEAASSLFERFEQADGTITRRFGGTGLGLPISKSLVELMGGTISATSTPGRGSTFRFDILLDRAECDVVANAQSNALAQVDRSRDLRILLAEDHPVNRMTVQMILDELQVEIICVENGKEAVLAAEAGDFDLMLMDMQMPVMDGLTAIRLIRAREALQGLGRVPICVLTANALPEHQSQASEAGANRFLTKPINAKDLIELVCEVGEAAQSL